MNRTLLKPHVSSIGYAIFLVINAAQIWGGIFPFLPKDFQTDEVTLTFYLSQTLSFCAAFIASTLGSYYFPKQARRMLVTLSTAMVFSGSSCIIAAMYLPVYTLLFILAGGVFLGVGTAGLFMLWQRYFSSIPSEACNYRLALGTVFASVCYFALYVVPTALTAFLVPLVFLPICALCLSLAVREMTFDQPMFEDIPREHPQVYLQLLKDSRADALCVGAIAFSSGLARGVAIINPAVSDVVNSASMTGSLIAGLILLALWLASSVRFGLRTIFRTVYPVIITGLLLFPFMHHAGLSLFAGLTYMTFSLILLIMMMQCAQTSRDRGTNPVFAYGFFGSVTYVMQSAGFLLGWFANDVTIFGVEQATLLSLIAAYVLGMALLASTGSFAGQATPESASQIEFTATTARSKEKASTASEKNAGKTRKPKKAIASDGHVITDRLSKQCLVVKVQYGLSSRETEVMELIARGRSMAAIAEDLFISENTVRTHCKHIYGKLDIHSRQELSDLVSNTEL